MSPAIDDHTTRKRIHSQQARQKPARKYDFSIIIVNYNVREFLRQALLSLRKALSNVSAEIFVVDNASDDGSAEMVRAQFPECYMIANEENLGFARANNLALKKARGRLVVLLNPDTVVQEDTFSSIHEFMNAHPETGMVGCKILNPDASLQLACRRSFPTPWVAFTKLAGLSRIFPRSRLFGRYNLTYLPEDRAYEVEAISGSFMVIRAQTLEQVGLLDEDFFMYGEDLDWCYRVREAGWKIHYFPETQIIHFKGESSRRSTLDGVRAFYQAMGLFVRKHFRRRMFVVSYWLLHLAIWARATVAFARSVLVALAVPFVDLLFMQLNLGVAIWLRFETSSVFQDYALVDIVYTAVWLICLAIFGCYQRHTFSSYQALIATSTGFLINASLTYFFKQYAFSRQVVLIAGLLNILLLSAWRLAIKILYHLGIGKFTGTLGRTMLSARTLVVGDFASDTTLVERLKLNVDSSYDLVGLVSLTSERVGEAYAGVPVLASLDTLDEYLRSSSGQRIQQVIFSTQKISFDRIIGVMSRQRSQHVSFKLVPSHLDVVIGKASIDEITEVPLVEIENRLLRFWPRLGKRVFDVILATTALIFLAPFFLIRFLIKREFETTDIIGSANDTFKLKSLKNSGRLGKWPWLWAIVKGKLTWVGRDIATTTPNIGLKPGITGLAQVNRRKSLSQEEKDKYYLYYVTHYSPLLDLEILFRSVFKI